LLLESLETTDWARFAILVLFAGCIRTVRANVTEGRTEGVLGTARSAIRALNGGVVISEFAFGAKLTFFRARRDCEEARSTGVARHRTELTLIETSGTIQAVRLAGLVTELANIAQRTDLTAWTISESAFIARVAGRLALEPLVQTRNTEQTIGQAGVVAELTRFTQRANSIVLGLGILAKAAVITRRLAFERLEGTFDARVTRQRTVVGLETTGIASLAFDSTRARSETARFALFTRIFTLLVLRRTGGALETLGEASHVSELTTGAEGALDSRRCVGEFADVASVARRFAVIALHETSGAVETLRETSDVGELTCTNTQSLHCTSFEMSTQWQHK
jgi:hypothetical protein